MKPSPTQTPERSKRKWVVKGTPEAFDRCVIHCKCGSDNVRLNFCYDSKTQLKPSSASVTACYKCNRKRCGAETRLTIKHKDFRELLELQMWLDAVFPEGGEKVKVFRP